MLKKILHPISINSFRDDYFEKKPLFIRGRLGKFDHIFQAEDFLCNLDRVQEIRAVFDGGRQAYIQPYDIRDMALAGATICVTGMEQAHPRLKKICETVKRDLGYRGQVSARAYLSPAGKGFDTHFDARITTTLQLLGRKRWWYSETPAEPFPISNSVLGRNSRYKTPTTPSMKSIVLYPGDLLCLPAGTWHRARGLDQSLAINLAFDHNGAGAAQILLKHLEHSLRRRPEHLAPLRQARNITNRRDAKQRLTSIAEYMVNDLNTILANPIALDALIRATENDA